MKQSASSDNEPDAREVLPPVGPLERGLASLSRIIVPMFSLFFMVFAMLFAGYAAVEFIRPVIEEWDVIKGLVKGLHTGVVALAVYELAQIVRQEHDHGRSRQALTRIRRGVARFGNVVFVALVLEALILVIKYSQQDLAGFLYYPAALIMSAAVLLIALGVFARLTALPSGDGSDDEL